MAPGAAVGRPSIDAKAALLIVDVQRYYLEAGSPFRAYSEARWPGSTAYLAARYEESLVPGIRMLREAFDAEGWPVIYLRLCGKSEDRSDLHRFFASFHREAETAGYPGAYPLCGEPMASVATDVAPREGDIVIDKTGFSGFREAQLEVTLRQLGVRCVTMAGLATSQCVDTTARDASDRGFSVAFAEDCLADYTSEFHECALYAAMGVCGGHVHEAAWIAAAPSRLLDLS